MADAPPSAELATDAAAPSEAKAVPEKVEAKVAPMADTPAGIWKALGIQDEPTEMAMLGRQQAMIAENAITCIGRNLHGMKVQATKTKSELTQTKQVQSVHAKDIDELKRLAGDNSALDDLKAEIAAVKKQAFEDNHRLQTQLTSTRSDLAKAREDLDKVASLPETVNLLVSQLKRLEARFDMLPPPFDPTEVWREMHGMATAMHKTEHDVHVLEAKQSEVLHLMAVEDAAADVVAGLDHNTFLQSGDVLEPGQSDFDLEVSTKGKNQHSNYAKNAYTTSSTKLCDMVTNQVEKVSKRSLAQKLHRATLVSTPMTETAMLLHNDTYMRLDAARIFYRWRDVWRNRRDGGFKLKLHEEEDWEEEPELEWDVSMLQSAAHVAKSQHGDFEKVLKARAKQVQDVELAERKQKLEDEKLAALMERDPEAAAVMISEREKAEAEARDKVAKEAEEAEAPAMYAGAELAAKYAKMAGLPAVAVAASTGGPSGGSSSSSGGSASGAGASVAVAASAGGSASGAGASIPEGDAGRLPPPATRAATAHHEPDEAKLKRHMEAKVQQKMSERMEIVRLGAEAARMQKDADVFGQVQASHTETIDRLLQDSMAMQEALGMLDESARRAAMAARNAGQAAETVVQSGSSDDFSKERKMLEKLIKDLKQTREDLETTDKEWKKKVNTIDQQLVPILPLERVVNHEILLDLLPKKADLIEHEKAVLELKDHFRRIVELEGKGLPPELLEALRMLKGMEGLKDLVKVAGKNIAKIFNEWATQEDIDKMENTIQDVDAKTHADIDSEVEELLSKMMGQSADWQRNLNSLGESINGTYRPWMSELEAAIRAEIERLKARGQGISSAELERRLAELRAKMEEMSMGGETGSAAFRCIACDRVLPDNNTWNPPPQRRSAAKTAHPAPGINPASSGNRKALAVKHPTSERIYKAGFPMTNPKIRPENRRMDHSRTFGRNMRPTLALGPSPGLGNSSQQSMGAGGVQQWDIVKAGDSQHGGDFSDVSSGYGRGGQRQQRPGTAEGLPSVYDGQQSSSGMPRGVTAAKSAPDFPGAMLEGEGSNHAAAPWPAASSTFDQHARGMDGGRPRTAGAVQ